MIDLSSYGAFETPSRDLTLKDAVARYLTLRTTEGLSDKGDTYRHLKLQLWDRLAGALGTLPLNLIRPDHLREWIRSLKNERTGKPFDAWTIRQHIASVKKFFRRVHGEGWIDRNPALVLVRPPVDDADVNIIPVQDAFHFFKMNRPARAIGRLALEAFGGLRYTTAGKIVKDDIKFQRRGIEMPAAKHKSRKRKFRQGQPANLWAWLEFAPDSCWELNLRQYREEKKEMHVRAGLREMVIKSDADRKKAEGLKNVWRHSFATYLLSRVKHFGPVSYLMQHTRAATTEIYEGMVDDQDAALYFAITPAAVLLSWEEFLAKYTPPPSSP